MLPIAPSIIAAVLAISAVTSPAPLQAPAATASPAALAEEVPSFNASDLDALRPNVGKEVEITGTPSNAGHSKSGTVLYLNFAGAHKGVALVFFVSSGATAGGADAGAAKKAQSEEDIKPFVGKTISVKGKLADYKGDLQIVVNTLDQIKVKE